MMGFVRRYGVVPVILLLVTACDDVTDPLADFDPSAPAAAMADMTAASEEMAPAFAGMRGANQVFGGSAFAALLAAAPAPTMDADARIVAARQLAAEAPAASVIPADYHGMTFVWSEAEGAYVPSEEAGAPTTGVRVRYYAVDPFTGEPVSPLNALGHIDLVDESTDSFNRVEVEVVSTPAGASPVTLADYHVQSSFAFTQSSVDVDLETAGYLSNGADRLDFNFVTAMAFTEAAVVATQAYEMSLAGTDTRVSYEGTLDADPETETGTFDVLVTVDHAGEQVVLDVVVDADDAVDGEMRYQGVAVVHVGGTSENPSFTRPNGEALSSEELAELNDLWQGVGSMFQLVAELVIFGG